MALWLPSACKGNGFREWPGWSASPVAGLFCLFEVAGAQGWTAAVAAHPGWHPWHLQPWTGAVTPGVVRAETASLTSLVVFPANGQGSGEIRLGLGQGGQRCLCLLEGGLILLAMGDQSVLIRGPLVHVGHRHVCAK